MAPSTTSILKTLPKERALSSVRSLFTKLDGYLPPAQITSILEAYRFGEEKHRGQTRASGEPYILHPIAVAHILADLQLDGQTISAAILHDVIEDTDAAKSQVAQLFGKEVAELVDGVSKLDQVQFSSKAEAQAENFRKMLLAMARDLRVILVKLADRLHNMRTLEALPRVKQRRIARETLEIYAPIANRLGINNMKIELEDMGFKLLYPLRYRVLEKSVKGMHGDHKRALRQVSKEIEKTLKKSGIDAVVSSRRKHIYSIYLKMKKKQLALKDIVDVLGLRIVTQKVDACYQALGIVHGLFKPMPGRFKDYIAIPRVNGYQSLHTILFGPKAVPLEVQIRTESMDRVAESGIASHWQYKSGELDNLVKPHNRTREWLQNLVDMQETTSSEEFLEHVKVDLFPDKVYVFTPKGDILRLPRGATVIDFAYAVHTDVGHRCVAAKVDRVLVTLRSQLKNGQSVEIITNRKSTPNPKWADFVVTAKARSAIRHYLRGLKHSKAIDLGKRMLENAIMSYGGKVKSIEKARYQSLLEELNIETLDDIYLQIGLGERIPEALASALLNERTVSDTSVALAIAGAEGMAVQYARCCRPIPGDSIVGYLSHGRGLVVHQNDCGNLADYRKDPDKWIPVRWDISEEQQFSVDIRVEANNRTGVLAGLADEIAKAESNIEQVIVDERDGATSSLRFLIQVRDRRHLAQVMRGIKAMPEVLKVVRLSA